MAPGMRTLEILFRLRAAWTTIVVARGPRPRSERIKTHSNTLRLRSGDAQWAEVGRRRQLAGLASVWLSTGIVAEHR